MNADMAQRTEPAAPAVPASAAEPGPGGAVPGGARGAGRVLVLFYGILALGATGRSAVQLLTRFEEAPLAYSLSAFAAVVYIVATIALIRRGRVWHTIAWAAILIEFAGVIVVGWLSALHAELFAHDSVWSGFGRGYLYIPLVLPIFGMAWLESVRRGTHADARAHR